jgi:F-type H+-transporting ATPase subunit alpha
MASITELRPDEITRILEQQLAGTLTSKELEDTGVVLQVGDGIARIYGLTEVQAGELIEFESGERGIVLNLEEDNVGAVVTGAPKTSTRGTA